MNKDSILSEDGKPARCKKCGHEGKTVVTMKVQMHSQVKATVVRTVGLGLISRALGPVGGLLGVAASAATGFPKTGIKNIDHELHCAKCESPDLEFLAIQKPDTTA